MATNTVTRLDTQISLSNDSSFAAEFPLAKGFELILIGADLTVVPHEHEQLVLNYKGNPYNIDTVIAGGDPVHFRYRQGDEVADFYGYVTDVHQTNGPRANHTDVVCVGASYLMKNTVQAIYKNLTADQIITKVCAKYGFDALTQHHPRVRPAITQAGLTDWQLMRSLAMQTGFALLASNTVITFMSKDKIYADKKPTAPYFNYVNNVTTGITPKVMRIYGTILDFAPIISDEAPESGVRADRIITGRHILNGTLIQSTYPYSLYNTANSAGAVIPGEVYYE
jgi:hypothetical protein